MPSFWEQQWHQFIFQLASYGHIVFLGTLGITVLGLGPIGRAIAARIRGGAAASIPPGSDPSLPVMRDTLNELMERLDFSERLLIEMREKTPGLPPITPPVRTPRNITPVG